MYTKGKPYSNAMRAMAMLDYVVSKGGERLSKRDIYEHVAGYVWHENASDKCPMIRDDMKYANDAQTEHLIAFDKQEYYLCVTKEQATDYRNRKIRSLKTLVAELRTLDERIGSDGKYDLLEDAIKVLFPEDHKDEIAR